MEKTPATILLVEDDLTLLENLAELLEATSTRYELSVLKATNGAIGLQLLADSAPDMVISDIMMPVMDGYEFLRKVRDQEKWIYIPFVFLTARSAREEILKGRRLGVELYITKPFSGVEFVELVESHLDRAFELRDSRDQRLLALKRDILQLLNHEFRTPLTYVTAYYEMLAEALDELEDVSELQDYLHGIQVGSVRLTQLVQDLIFILDLRTGDAARSFEQKAGEIKDVGGVIRALAEAREDGARAKYITLHCDIASDLPPIYGHAPSLSDALDRIVENAIKFTPYSPGEDKTVRLEAVNDAGWIRLAIHDQGIGFPAQVSTQIFDLFYQYNRDYLEQQGSGSGLAIAKGIVELHGGLIEVESEEGKGSSFHVLLPASTSRSQAPPLLKRQTTVGSQPATVLLVEDDRFLLEGLRELLEVYEGKYTLHVLTATNGNEGLRMLAVEQPDLIISDVMMPEMDGYAFLQEVRKRASWLQIPVIFLTARSEPKEIHRGLLSGVEEYIPKPYDVDELINLVVTQLDRHFAVQSAVRQSFEELKRSILRLLRPDFMAPLETVSRHSRMLEHSLQNVNTDQDLRSSLYHIREASKRLAYLVEDMIALAEFKTGEAELGFASRAEYLKGESLSAHLRAYAAELQHDAREAGVSFDYSVPGRLPMIRADLQGLKQSIGRLVRVALEFCRTGGADRIVFSAYAEPATLVLLMETPGAGLDDNLALLMQRFCQSSEISTLELPNSSSGPSLMVVKGVLGLHGAQLRIDDEAGSVRMLVRLPALSGASDQPPAAASLPA